MASSGSTSFSFSSPSTPEQPRIPNASIRGTANAMTSGSAAGTSLVVQVDSVVNTRSAPPPSSIPPPPVDSQVRQSAVGSRVERMEDSKTRSGRKYQNRRSRESAAAPSAAGPTISESHSDRAEVDSESLHTKISIEDSQDSDNSENSRMHLDEHARMPTSSLRRADRHNRSRPQSQQRFQPSFSSSSSPAPTSSASHSSSHARMTDRQSVRQALGVDGQVGVSSHTSPHPTCTPTGANAVRVACNPALQQAAILVSTPTVEADCAPPTPPVTPPVVPHTPSRPSNENLLTTILQSFTDILAQNQRILQQVTPHARHNIPQQPLSSDPLSPQSLAGIVETDTQAGVDSYGNMPAARIGSEKVKMAWCTSLSLTPYTDMDEWFLKFERLLTMESVDPRLWFKALVQRCMSNLKPTLSEMPEEDRNNYEKVRDKICNKYGPRAPLVDIETKIREIPQKGLTITKLIAEIDFLMNKYRRIAERLGRRTTEFPGPTVLTIIKSCLPQSTYKDFRYQLDQYISAGIDYESVRVEVEGRLNSGRPEEVLQKGKTETAPVFPFKHSSTYLEEEDRVKMPHRVNVAVTDETESEEDDCYNVGPIHKRRMQESGLLSNKHGSNPPTRQPPSSRDEKKCFYCNQRGHFKLECPVRKHHEGLGKVLVDRNRTRQLVSKLTDRSRNARKVFFMRRPYGGRFPRNRGIRPQGPIRAIRRPYRRRFRPDRQRRSSDWNPTFRKYGYRNINKVNVVASLNEASEDKSDCLRIIGYADDAALICKADTMIEIENMLNQQLESIRKWSVQNRVQFNPQKLASIILCNHLLLLCAK